jgi:hypothetical protein
MGEPVLTAIACAARLWTLLVEDEVHKLMASMVTA